MTLRGTCSLLVYFIFGEETSRKLIIAIMKKKFDKITVDCVKPSQFNPNISVAQLRQEVSFYRTRRNRFAFTSTRIAFVDVPHNTPIEKVEKLLSEHRQSRIISITSYNVADVLTDEQKESVRTGHRTMSQYMESFKIKDTEERAIYRQHFFRKHLEDDIDYSGKYNATTIMAIHEELGEEDTSTATDFQHELSKGCSSEASDWMASNWGI